MEIKKQLLKLNFAITLVDSDPALLQYFDEKYDLACINGHPSHADVLALAIASERDFKFISASAGVVVRFEARTPAADIAV